jgi:2'-5' RNA ligase
MDGIATMLDEENYNRVLALWEELQVRCAIPEIRSHLLPHFTWHVAEAYDDEKLIQAMGDLCSQLKPFTVKTTGLGIFAGEKPIIYVNIVKDLHLIEVHQKLWNIFTPLASQPSLLYSPESWVPHITLFFDEIFDDLPEDWDTHRVTMCVLDLLARQRFDWHIQADNFAYGRMDGSTMHVKHYPFGC